MTKQLLAFVQVCLLWAMLAQQGLAQSSACAQALNHAQRLYDEGKLSMIEGVLSDCIKMGFTSEERVKAYRLLTLSCLFSDKYTEADEYFTKLLRIQPGFFIDKENDPAELIKIHQSFRTSPVVSFSMLLGTNRSNAFSSKAYSTSSASYDSTDYQTSSGGYAAVAAELHLNSHWSLQIQGKYNSLQFDFNHRGILDYVNLHVAEQQNWLQVPVLLKYQLSNKKFSPFIYAGGVAQRLLSAKISIERVEESTEVKGANIGVNRRANNYGLIGGIGLKYQFNRTSIFICAQHEYTLLNQPIHENRYANNELLYKFGYIENDFSTRQWAFGVGVSYHFYNPQKLKKKS